jgi:hypothetical protein
MVGDRKRRRERGGRMRDDEREVEESGGGGGKRGMGRYGVEIQSRFSKKFVQPVEKGGKSDFKMVYAQRQNSWT